MTAMDVYKLAVNTPLIESLAMSEHTGNMRVHLKLDNAQPVASFKIRGVGLRCLRVREAANDVLTP